MRGIETEKRLIEQLASFRSFPPAQTDLASRQAETAAAGRWEQKGWGCWTEAVAEATAVAEVTAQLAALHIP